jgi:uncharacterized Zn finger protein
VRESAAVKGRRYVSEGRLVVEHIDAETIRATCRGAGAVYRLSYAEGRWSCDCPAVGACAHLHALWLVAVR